MTTHSASIAARRQGSSGLSFELTVVGLDAGIEHPQVLEQILYRPGVLSQAGSRELLRTPR